MENIAIYTYIFYASNVNLKKEILFRNLICPRKSTLGTSDQVASLHSCFTFSLVWRDHVQML